MNINQRPFFVFQPQRDIMQLYALIFWEGKTVRFHFHKWKNSWGAEVTDLAACGLLNTAASSRGSCVQGLGCNRDSVERSHFPSLTLLFLFCKSGLRIKVHFDICLGHLGRESSLHRSGGQDTDYISCYCWGNRYRQVGQLPPSPTPPSG